MTIITQKILAFSTLAMVVAGGALSNLALTTTQAAEGIITNKRVALASTSTYGEVAQATPGDEVSFRVFLQNATGATAVAPRINDILDSRLSYVPGSSMLRIKQDNKDVDIKLLDNLMLIEGQKLGWQFDDMGSTPDKAIYLSFKAKVADASKFQNGTTALQNCATATFNRDAISQGTNCVTINVNKSATETVSFTISKEVTNLTLGDSKWYSSEQLASAKPGDKIGYRLTIINTGNTPAQNVTLKDVLPAGVQFAGKVKLYDNTANQAGTPIAGDAIVKNGYVFQTLQNGNLNYKRITFEATVTANCQNTPTLQNTAKVVHNSQTVAQDTAGFLVTCDRDLIIVKDVLDPASNQYKDTIGTVKGDSVLTYRINVINNGSETAVNPTVRDVLPAGAQYVKGSLRIDGEQMSAATEGYFFSTGMVLTTLNPGLGKVITLQIKVKCVPGNTAQKLVNTAFVKVNGKEISDTAEASIEACDSPTPTPTPTPPITPPVTPPTELPKSGPVAGLAILGTLSGAGATLGRYLSQKNALKKSLSSLEIL